MSETRAPYPDTWLIAQDYDPNDHVMKLKGKDYIDVQNRMVWFIRDQRALIAAGLATHPHRVTTDLVELDREAGWAHFRTTVCDVLGNESTAYGSESARDFGDYIEKAATKSLGRALIGLGYGTQFAPEISEGEEARPVDSPMERRQPAPMPPRRAEKPASRPAPPQAPVRPTATPAPLQRDTRPSDAPADERVAKALRNQSVMAFLSALGIDGMTERRAHVTAVLKRLDGKAEGQPVTGRDLMDALEAEVTAKDAKSADGHDLSTTFQGGVRP